MDEKPKPGIKEVRVRCDEMGCGWWSEPLKHFPEDLLKWHNVKCPKCGVGVIVSDDDLATVPTVAAILEMGRVAAKLNPDAEVAEYRVTTEGGKINFIRKREGGVSHGGAEEGDAAEGKKAASDDRRV